MSDEALALLAGRFAALADPLRLRLLHLLFEGDANVHTLAERSGGSLANVSRHLQTLATAGVLARRREGLQVVYSLADPTVRDLCATVCGSLERHLRHQAKAFSST